MPNNEIKIQFLPAVPGTDAAASAAAAAESAANAEVLAEEIEQFLLQHSGNVFAVGSPSVGEIARWTDATHLEGLAAPPWVPLIGGVLGPVVATISAGAITATASYIQVDTEGLAGGDDLTTINGATAGQIVVLSSVSDDRDILVKDGTVGGGNLRLAGDFALDNSSDTLTLMSTGGLWLELSRSANTAIPAVFPFTGALGLWYADAVATTGGNTHIPNELHSLLPARNLLRGSRRCFNNTDFWTKNDMTVVDNTVVGPDGFTEASHIDAASTGSGSGWFLAPATPNHIGGTGGVFYPWPAGTYTAAINVKRGTGTNQTFRIEGTIFGTASGVLTATASWQRFSFTFTHTSGSLGPRLIQGGSINAILDICNFELYQGSTDLGPELLAGHINLGYPLNNLAPTVSGQYLDFTAATGVFGPWGSLQLPHPVTATAFTVSILVNQTSAGNDPAYLITKSQDQDNFSLLNKGWSGADRAAIQWSFGGVNFGDVGGMQTTFGAGPHVITYWYDGNNARIYYDDTIVRFEMAPPGGEASHPGLSVLLGEFYLMMNQNAATNNGVKFGAMAMWDRALGRPEIYNVVDVWRARFSFTLQTNYLFADGEEISSQSALVPAGTLVKQWPYYVPALLTAKVIGANLAVGGVYLSAKTGETAPVGGDDGWTLPPQTATKSLLQLAIPPATRQIGRRFILVDLIGANNYRLFEQHIDTSPLVPPLAPGAYGTTVGNILATGYTDPLDDAGYEIWTCCLLDRVTTTGVTTAELVAFLEGLRNIILPGGVSWAHGAHTIDLPTSAGSHFGDAADVPHPYDHAPATSNMTYYTGDSIHLTTVGAQTVAGFIAARLAATGL